MDENKKLKVLLFGLGAIGGYYAFIIGRNPNISLSVTARSNYDKVKQDGLLIDSAIHGKHKVRIDEVLRYPADANTKFDFIVCTHKALNPSSTTPLFHPVADSRTTFVILQNGVGNEDPFHAAFPSSTIISGVVWVGATQTAPGVIKHINAEHTDLGLFHNPNLDPQLQQRHLDTFADIFRTGGTPFTIERDIQVKRWEKVVWNAAWNPITTLTGVESHAWLESSDDAMEFTRRLWREMIDVARACGVGIEYAVIEELLAKAKGLPSFQTSMYADAREGRQLEVEVILGTPMRKARELRLEVPVLQAVYAMTKAVNLRVMREGQERGERIG